MKTITVAVMFFIVIIGILVVTGVLTGRLNIDITGNVFFGKTEETEQKLTFDTSGNGLQVNTYIPENIEDVDYIVEWRNGCYIIKHKSTNTLIGEYSPQEFAELDIKAVPLPPLETATVDYRIYSIKVPDINNQIFFLDPDDLIYVPNPSDFTVPYNPPFVYIPDDPIAFPYDPPFMIIPPPIIITPDQ